MYDKEYLKKILAGVSQGKVLGPILYLLHTTSGDDTAIMTVGDYVEEATSKLQRSINTVSKWKKTVVNKT